MHQIWERENDSAHGLRVGDRVEVATHFTGTWASGFEVAAVSANGYRIRRVSDGAVLPIAFRPDAIRPEQPAPDVPTGDVPALDVDVLGASALAPSVVVRFPAELDMQTVDAVAPAIMDQVENAYGEVVLDLDGVQFLDTYGIRLLMQVRRCAWQRDLPVRLHGGKPIIRALLDLLGVDPLFVPEDREVVARALE
jgi:anti-anti-sigma factor